MSGTVLAEELARSTAAVLRDELKSRGCLTSGVKSALIERLAPLIQSEREEAAAAATAAAERRRKSTISLRICAPEEGELEVYRLKMTDNLGRVFSKYTASRDAGPAQFLFDGEVVAWEATPLELDLEDEDQIDFNVEHAPRREAVQGRDAGASREPWERVAAVAAAIALLCGGGVLSCVLAGLLTEPPMPVLVLLFAHSLCPALLLAFLQGRVCLRARHSILRQGAGETSKRAPDAAAAATTTETTLEQGEGVEEAARAAPRRALRPRRSPNRSRGRACDADRSVQATARE